MFVRARWWWPKWVVKKEDVKEEVEDLHLNSKRVKQEVAS